jgi:hypothetical protein
LALIGGFSVKRLTKGVGLVALPLLQRDGAMDIIMEDGQVLVKGPKCLIVLTKAQFIEALKRGKAYRRQQSMQGRLAQLAQNQRSPMGEGGE